MCHLLIKLDSKSDLSSGWRITFTASLITSLVTQHAEAVLLGQPIDCLFARQRLRIACGFLRRFAHGGSSGKRRRMAASLRLMARKLKPSVCSCSAFV